MKTTLLIMAAGIGSRFGTGIKQLEPVDDAGHIIMDYSIHDALEAGFNHVNIPVSVSLLSGDRKLQIRFLGNHHSGSGNLYHKSFRM